MKNFNINIIHKFFILLILFFIFLCFSAYSYVNAVSSDISSGVFRLHVIANSDSEEDQDLKYKVRDALLNYMNSICADATSKCEAIDIAKSHVEDFKKIALSVVYDNGFSYDVNVVVGEYYFPTKDYGDVSLPSGIYDALRVEIGSANGHNWWCVMFPPLCFVDISSGIVPDSSKEILKDNMSDEGYELVTDSSDSSELNFKFKLVELFEDFKLKLANKSL